MDRFLEGVEKWGLLIHSILWAWLASVMVYLLWPLLVLRWSME